MIETGTSTTTEGSKLALTVVGCLYTIDTAWSTATVDGFTIGRNRGLFNSMFHTKEGHTTQKGHCSNQEIIRSTKGSVLSTEETPDPGDIVIGMKFTRFTTATQAVDIRHRYPITAHKF
jgi:hypothetical protein